MHHHFGESPIQFHLIGDSLCSVKLYRGGVDTTVKLSSNTRVQIEQLIQLSKSFRTSTVNVYRVPSVANLGYALTRISKTLVTMVNGAKYRHGNIKEGLEYIDLHKQFL